MGFTISYAADYCVIYAVRLSELYRMNPAIEAFELLASRWVKRWLLAGLVHIRNLVHPVHREGCVFGWEIVPLVAN